MLVGDMGAGRLYYETQEFWNDRVQIFGNESESGFAWLLELPVVLVAFWTGQKSKGGLQAVKAVSKIGEIILRLRKWQLMLVVIQPLIYGFRF